MNTKALFIFLIILLGLLLCSFLGGNCNNEGFTTTSDQNNTSTNGNGNGNKIGKSTSSNMSYDNYNHFNGSSTQLASGTTFYGSNGGSVVVNTNSDGQQTLQVTLKNGQQPMTFTTQEPTSSNEGYTNYYGNSGNATTFYGPSGATATVVNANNGQQAINVQTSSGSYTYTESGTSTYNPNNTSSTQ